MIGLLTTHLNALSTNPLLSSCTQAVRNIVHTSNHGIILELVKFRHHLGDLETARQAIEETFLDFATTLRNNS